MSERRILNARSIKTPDWEIDDSVTGLHPDAHRIDFSSRHSHKPTKPMYDLIVNDILTVLLPTHRTSLNVKFIVLTIVLVYVIYVGAEWLDNVWKNSSQYSLARTFASIILHGSALAWTIYYFQVTELIWNSVRHNQPTWWMDPTVAAVNRLPMHTTSLRLFANEENARRAACLVELATRETKIQEAQTPNVWKLDDLQWTLELHVTVQFALDAVKDKNKHLNPRPVKIPGNWMLQGFYDKPIYTNIKYPFPCRPPLVPLLNPTGRYCVTLGTLPLDWEQAIFQQHASVTLMLHGIESAAYVYLNDGFIGFTKDSRLPAEFDLTPIIQPSNNVLEIVVVRWSDGSYVEDQDHWWMAGIHRSVELILRPRLASIMDYQVQADANGRLTCRVECRENVDVESTDNLSSSPDIKRKLLVSLYDDAQTTAMGAEWVKGKCVFQSEELVVSGNVVTFSSVVNNIQLWTAETPHLYTMTIQLLVDGKVTQVESCRIGFRSGSIENGQYLVNGVAITVCGINRHEHDPDTGKVVSLESMKRDIMLLKQNNFNAVRTSHYPNHPCFYRLCDFYGLYVCDEANIETHGLKPMGRLAHDPGWESMFVSRVVRMVQRDRNHACIMFWSLGNEAGRGRNLQKARDIVKRLDQSRPVCYESGGEFYWGAGNTELTDLVCNMYPDVPLTIELATRNDEDRPVVLCEYSHAMGNSSGNLHLYWEAFWDPAIPRLQGGYIWDMVDQGLRKTSRAGVEYFGYGGDFGDTCNDLQFCCNGLFSPDRNPHPAVAEAKFLMQPVDFAPDCAYEMGAVKVMVNGRQEAQLRFRVTNRYSFLDLSHLVWSWYLKFDGSLTTLHAGTFNILNGNSANIRLDAALRRIRLIQGQLYFLHIRGALKSSCSWADAGHVVVSHQFKVDFAALTPAIKADVSLNSLTEHLAISNNGECWVIKRVAPGRTNTPLARVEQKSGRLCFLSHHGLNILADDLTINTTRASTDNDKGGFTITPGLNASNFFGWLRGYDNFSYATRWKCCGLDQAAPPVTKCRTSFVSDSGDKQTIETSTKFDILSADSKKLLFNAETTYSFQSDGAVQVSCEVSPRAAVKWLSSLPRIGINLQLNASLYHIQYFGRGPDENYPDRKSGSELGVYETSPANMGYLQYVYPVENGSRSDCEWIAFRRDDGTGLCICTDGPTFSCSALLHSATELENATHTCDLAERKDGYHTIHVNLDHKLMGVGGDTSWYPVVYEQFRVKPSQDYKFRFWLLPLEPNDNPAMLTRRFRKIGNPPRADSSTRGFYFN
ncbi:hypothetical protein MPSEU_001001800 [Mayamaea pseudoterrestris]|nr:hypothetical protein MPSEU_001001800 [Mayamaea pseudoterrestris]